VSASRPLYAVKTSWPLLPAPSSADRKRHARRPTTRIVAISASVEGAIETLGSKRALPVQCHSIEGNVARLGHLRDLSSQLALPHFLALPITVRRTPGLIN